MSHGMSKWFLLQIFNIVLITVLTQRLDKQYPFGKWQPMAFVLFVHKSMFSKLHRCIFFLERVFL